jgi:NitT/TauT family transport system permease protein
MTRVFPVLTVLAALVAVWYAAAVWMNATWVFDQAQTRNGQDVTWAAGRSRRP